MKRLYLVIVFLGSILGVSLAEEYVAPGSKARLSLYIDNDVFFGEDRDYSNGGRIAWISDRKTNLRDLPYLQRKLSLLTGYDGNHSLINGIWGFEDPDEVKLQYGVALNQLIFTPSFRGEEPRPNQRPYASWASLGFSVHASDEKAINSVEVNFGVVGPNSYGQETQNLVHDLIEAERFQGWDRQVPDEFTFNIHLKQTRRYNLIDNIGGTPFSLNAFTDAGVSAGNYRVDATTGGRVQFGYNVPYDFSDYRLSPTANSISWSNDHITPKFSAYLVGGVNGSVVLHDITLDGNVLREFNTGTESETLVGEFYFGLGMRYKDVELSYITTTRSKEYIGQEESQSFGSVAVRYKF
ncbi:lipid A deacylase LpxR family protein [Akkermansiaceae bacterium]|nr:lipid A deacylase LpxR family protein [Akkermansiaceae bacterium]